MKDRLLTAEDFYKLERLGLCNVYLNGGIDFTEKAERKYPKLKGRCYNLRYLGTLGGEIFEVPDFTMMNQKQINNYNSYIILTIYSFKNFWRELNPNNFKEISL